MMTFAASLTTCPACPTYSSPSFCAMFNDFFIQVCDAMKQILVDVRVVEHGISVNVIKVGFDWKLQTCCGCTKLC